MRLSPLIKFWAVGGGWSLSQLSRVKRKGTSWTGLEIYHRANTQTSTLGQFGITNKLNRLHVYGLWEEA